MKKVLIVFCGALIAICLLNVNFATKSKVAKSTSIVSLKKALADGENDPAPYPSNNPDDYVNNPTTGNSSLDDPIKSDDPVHAQPGLPTTVKIN